MRVKQLIQRAANVFGYRIERLDPQLKNIATPQFELRQYTKDNGEFDYERYRATQINGNKTFISNTWVIEENVNFLSRYLQMNMQPIRFGICHGSRRGDEQRWFREQLHCEVIGTDISDTAHQFPWSVQWDFHEPNPEWTGKTDFIYSNAIDHSYAPEQCLRTWVDTLRPGGLCILEHSDMHSPKGVTELDPFGATIEIMPYLIALWGKGDFYLRELISAPVKPAGVGYLCFLVIQRR
jgi:hypothetical protein